MKNKLILAILLSFSSAFGTTAEHQVNIEVSEIHPGLYRLFINEAVAVVLISGDEGSLLIDAGFSHTASALEEWVYKLTDRPLRYLINTHLHADYTGGNTTFGKQTSIIAHENVRLFLEKCGSQGSLDIPDHALPSITFTDRLDLRLNQQVFQMFHLPGGHTDGDIIVYVPHANVLILGDLLFADYFPYIDTLYPFH